MKTQEEKTKAPLKSKTVWAGLLTSLVGVVSQFSPALAGTIKSHESMILAVIGLIMVILRAVTKKPILLLMLGVCCLGLQSCAQLAELKPHVSVKTDMGEFGYSSKGGLTFVIDQTSGK